MYRILCDDTHADGNGDDDNGDGGGNDDGGDYDDVNKGELMAILFAAKPFCLS